MAAVGLGGAVRATVARAAFNSRGSNAGLCTLTHKEGKLPLAVQSCDRWGCAAPQRASRLMATNQHRSGCTHHCADRDNGVKAPRARHCRRHHRDLVCPGHPHHLQRYHAESRQCRRPSAVILHHDACSTASDRHQCGHLAAVSQLEATPCRVGCTQHQDKHCGTGPQLQKAG